MEKKMMNTETQTQTNTPTLGGAATYVVWSDSYACTVIHISKNGKIATLRRDKAQLLNGTNSSEPDALSFSPGGFCGHTSGTQRYSYEPNPEGETFRVSARTRSDGRTVWKTVGQATKTSGGTARFGTRDEHYDYNF
jgi:hypothetical protein